MSDQNFGGGGVATLEPPAESYDAAATGSRRNLIVVGIAVAVALAIAVWFLFLSGGGSSTPGGSVPSASLKAGGAASSPGAGAVTTPVKSASPGTNGGRDPFKPLIVAPTAKPSASVVSSAPAATPTPTPTIAPSSSAPAGNVLATVTLKSIDTKAHTASFDVSGTKYNAVAIGDTFASFFKLYDLGSKCAQVQYGDVTNPVCLGAPLQVQ